MKSRIPKIMAVLVVFMGVASQACYTKHYSLDGTEMPVPAKAETIQLVAGVQEVEREIGSESVDLPSSEVVGMLAERLKDEEVFQTVVYPYTEMAMVDSDVVLKVSVEVFEDTKMGQNMVKAFLTGFTFFLLAPVLPTTFEMTVSIEAEAYSSSGELINSYQEDSKYRFESTKLIPTEQELKAFISDSARHAVEEMVNEIKTDQGSYRNLGANDRSRGQSAVVMVYSAE